MLGTHTGARTCLVFDMLDGFTHNLLRPLEIRMFKTMLIAQSVAEAAVKVFWRKTMIIHTLVSIHPHAR